MVLLLTYVHMLAICSSSTDGVLSLGDEILSVNGRSLLGFNHAQAVEVLTSCGPDVTLCVRPNHTYRGACTVYCNILHCSSIVQ